MLKGVAALLFASWTLFSGCPYKNDNCSDCKNYKYKIKKVSRFPDNFKESSGLARQDMLYFSNGDSGNDAELITFRFEDYLADNFMMIVVPGVSNHDWEDLATDDSGNIYIGDFGNNSNNRTNLSIIKFSYTDRVIQRINFNYAKQITYPPNSKKSRNFDSEAFFWDNGQLYLFSKNKKWPYVHVHTIPDTPGNYQVFPFDSLKLHSPVTSADISPDKSEIALLSYGKVMLFHTTQDEDGRLFFTPYRCRKFLRSGQSEAIMYLDNDHLLITNEKGKMFVMSKKAKPRSNKY